MIGKTTKLIWMYPSDDILCSQLDPHLVDKNWNAKTGPITIATCRNANNFGARAFPKLNFGSCKLSSPLVVRVAYAQRSSYFYAVMSMAMAMEMAIASGAATARLGSSRMLSWSLLRAPRSTIVDLRNGANERSPLAAPCVYVYQPMRRSCIHGIAGTLFSAWSNTPARRVQTPAQRTGGVSFSSLYFLQTCRSSPKLYAVLHSGQIPFSSWALRS